LIECFGELHEQQTTTAIDGQMANAVKKKLVVCGGNGFLGSCMSAINS
jgi:hypothetical protein